MKIDRRSFIALGVGVIAGSTLSPVPWKLTDDISIWTQNWPWTPVPKDGRVSHKTSVCTLCPGGCGIQVRRVIDRAVRIDGLPEHPINHGRLCPLGLSGLQFLYGPSRVKSPMKRVGERGEGKWQNISWKEAIETISGELKKLRDQGKPHSVTWVAEDDRGTVPRLIGRFLTAYGSPNFIKTPDVRDAYELAAYLMQGRQGNVGYDIEKADHILSFGAGILQGWGSPARLLHIHGKMNKDKTLVQIEPRLSETAANADQWVPVKPGTEGVLALGIAHLMIRESLYRKSFINNQVAGFEDWTDENGNSHEGFKTLVMKDYSPEIVAQITGVPPKTIAGIARRFARAKKPLAISGRGNGRLPGSIAETMAVHALNALVGNINRPGGVSVMPEPEYGKWPEVKIDKTAAESLQQPRIDGAGTSSYPEARYLLHRLPGVINKTKGDSPVQALFVSGANPLYTLPDTAAAKTALERIPLLVSCTPFMNETANFSDLILPTHTFLEQYVDVPPPAGTTQPIIGLARPVVRPAYDTRHLGDIVIQMAKSLGSFVGNAFPWKNYQAFLEEALKDDWDKLSEKGYARMPALEREARADRFNTASGKFEFRANDMKGVSDSATAVEGEVDQYPLVLIPYDSMRISNGAVGNPPFMTKTIDADVLKDQACFVEINPETAGKLRLSNGDRVVIKTPRGQAEVRLHLFDGIAPGVVAMPAGLGHTAYSKYLAGKGVNINNLIGPVEDPGSGLNAAWGVRANLTRA